MTRPRFVQAKNLVISEFEKHYLERALAAARGNVSEAARRAGKDRRAFFRLLKKHNIDCAAYRR